MTQVGRMVAAAHLQHRAHVTVRCQTRKMMIRPPPLGNNATMIYVDSFKL